MVDITAVHRNDAVGNAHVELALNDTLHVNAVGYQGVFRCDLAGKLDLAGTKGVPRFTHESLAQHRDGLVILTGCRHGELSRRLLAGDREGAVRALERLEGIAAAGGLYVELQHHLLPDDDWLTAELARLAHQAGLPTTSGEPARP